MQQAQDSTGERQGSTTQPIVIGLDLSRASDISLVVVTRDGREPLIGDAALSMLHALQGVITAQASRRSPHPGVGRKFGGPNP